MPAHTLNTTSPTQARSARETHTHRGIRHSSAQERREEHQTQIQDDPPIRMLLSCSPTARCSRSILRLCHRLVVNVERRFIARLSEIVVACSNSATDIPAVSLQRAQCNHGETPARVASVVEQWRL
jgi:hypothetical protein